MFVQRVSVYVQEESNDYLLPIQADDPIKAALDLLGICSNKTDLVKSLQEAITLLQTTISAIEAAEKVA